MNTPSARMPRPIRTYTRHERALVLDCDGPLVSISVLQSGIVRVRLAPDGSFAPRRSWAVTPPDEDFSAISFEIEETSHTLLLKTDMLTVHIERETCRLSFADAAGRIFCADEQGMQVGRASADVPLFVDLADYDPDRRVACVKRIEEGEHFFGFGERAGQLDKRGRQMINWTTDPAIDVGHGIGTDPLYLAIPVFMSLRPGLAYGVFFNNTWRSRFSIGWDQAETWLMEAYGGELDYYVIYGPTPADVSAGLGTLLGTMPLPPRWALGYHQSRWGYDTEAIVRNVAAKLRQHHIPCDTIHLDIDYMNGYRVFTWDAERFPDPPALIGDLKQQGFRVVTIIDPGVKIDLDYAVYRDGLEHGMFVQQANGEVFRGYVWPGAAVFPDFTRPEVRQWWGDWLKVLLDQGISGIWNDMNEPAVFDRDFAEGIGNVVTIPTDAQQGPADERTTHAEVHNLYGHGMDQATYQGLQRHRGDERPFVLTRSGFAGIQRWSACWMGDNSSVWEHLEMSMPQLLNMGLSGVPFVGTDIGGFFGHGSGELLARWIQIGALTPFCRGHSCTGTAAQEPWAFGEQVERIYRDYLQLRYRLLPYLYTLFWEASQRATPILRPLFYHFPDDPATYPIHDQVFVGPFLMAAPIYQPGRTHRTVYLPAGIWFDWWTGEPVAGPTSLLAHAPLERMPLYVRAGAILPTGPDMECTDEQPLDPLTLDIYPGNGTFTLYEDDGHTCAYQRGHFCTTDITLHLDDTSRQLSLTIGARAGDYSPPPRQLIIKLHHMRIQQEHAAGTYEAAQHLLTLTLSDDGSERIFTFQM